MEQNILTIIADNENLSEALKKMLEDEFILNDSGHREMSNERLGEIYRAKIVGIEKIRETFKKIQRLKSHTDIPVRDRSGR